MYAAQVFTRLWRAKTKLAYASYFQARNGGGRFALESCAARHRQARFLIREQGERLAYNSSCPKGLPGRIPYYKFDFSQTIDNAFFKTSLNDGFQNMPICRHFSSEPNEAYFSTSIEVSRRKGAKRQCILKCHKKSSLPEDREPMKKP